MIWEFFADYPGATIFICGLIIALIWEAIDRFRDGHPDHH